MEIKICSRCIYSEQTPGISFNADDVCNYCEQVENLAVAYQTGKPEGIAKLNAIIEDIKKAGKGKKYDCVIGVSGGTDSSYLLIKALEWGLRPLAVHYDNTWNSSIATENIRKVSSKLNVDLFTYVVDNKEADDIFKSFLLAGVPEFDASTDIGFVQVLRSAAAKYGVKYILEGHSFMAEGVSPQGKNYFDGKYIESVHKQYGKLKLKTYPNLTFFQFMKWVLIYRQKFIRPLWYIDYSKPDARKILEETTGWTYYGGHHLENRSTSFLHTIYNPQKFSIDNRNWSLSAEARTGVISRDEALKIYNAPIASDPELVEYVKKRLKLSDSDYDSIMNGPKRSNKDFKTYKKRFEFLRPLFFVLAKAELVPRSFYLKYCFPFPNE
ncbi:N-acetyl sugar amidotransferase [Aquirufa antheringensis]|uniref:N-acetyl sugar amidotransferase n=1 Tax=Aquirufa antheringensis TaxID=2516559 RepID=UPI0022A9BD38|nr:N-acetyl sugar amidotransferase [Aquirufa antheringensis]MCZ2490061.1 N-acetyl sugar amidotransferase [Aquirufa antheringensis]